MNFTRKGIGIFSLIIKSLLAKVTMAKAIRYIYSTFIYWNKNPSLRNSIKTPIMSTFGFKVKSCCCIFSNLLAATLLNVKTYVSWGYIYFLMPMIFIYVAQTHKKEYTVCLRTLELLLKTSRKTIQIWHKHFSTLFFGHLSK